MNNVLLEEIGGRPLRVRPIPVMSQGGRGSRMSGPVELEQVSAGDSSASSQRLDSRARPTKDSVWRTALRGVAVCGGMVIMALVLVVGRRSSRR